MGNGLDWIQRVKTELFFFVRCVTQACIIAIQCSGRSVTVLTAPLASTFPKALENPRELHHSLLAQSQHLQKEWLMTTKTKRTKQKKLKLSGQVAVVMPPRFPAMHHRQ
jgi:hypothetical protein